MKKLLSIIFILSLLITSCDYAKEKATKEAMKSLQPKQQPQLDESKQYHAVVEEEMTLAEVADTNSVAISFLKQSLGIPHYVDHPYTVLQLSRNYQFTVGDLKLIIEAYKDKKTLQSEKSATKE